MDEELVNDTFNNIQQIIQTKELMEEQEILLMVKIAQNLTER
jgi:hypothetical protein